MGLISTNVAELLEEEKINEVFEYLEIYRDSLWATCTCVPILLIYFF